MATIYMIQRSVLKPDQMIETYIQSNVLSHIAEEKVSELNAERSQEDHKKGILFLMTLQDLTEEEFYN